MITVAGGEDIWVYVNGSLVIELLSDPLATDVSCKSINISAASEDGNLISFIKCALLWTSVY